MITTLHTFLYSDFLFKILKHSVIKFHRFMSQIYCYEYQQYVEWYSENNKVLRIVVILAVCFHCLSFYNCFHQPKTTFLGSQSFLLSISKSIKANKYSSLSHSLSPPSPSYSFLNSSRLFSLSLDFLFWLFLLFLLSFYFLFCITFLISPFASLYIFLYLSFSLFPFPFSLTFYIPLQFILFLTFLLHPLSLSLSLFLSYTHAHTHTHTLYSFLSPSLSEAKLF